MVGDQKIIFSFVQNKVPFLSHPYLTMAESVEKWIPFSFTDKYEISDMGRVRNASSGEIRKNMVKDKRNTVSIHYGEIDKKITVGREVLTCFVRKGNFGECCSHLNGNTQDDRLDNLEWSNLPRGPIINPFKGTPVKVQYEDECIEYNSVQEAAGELGVKPVEIYDSMREGKVVHKLDHVTIIYAREIPAEDAIIKDVHFGKNVVEVSSDGFVCLKGTNKWKRGRVERGYLRTTFQFDKQGNKRVNDKGKNLSCGHDIHRLVALAFFGDPVGNKTDVDHIDEDKLNNNYYNLRWLSRSENTKRSCKPPGQKKVYQYENGVYVADFISASAAARSMDSNNAGGVSACATGKRPHWKGFKWSYEGPKVRKMCELSGIDPDEVDKKQRIS